MQDAYSKSQNLKIVMSVQVFGKSGATAPYYSLDVSIKKSGDRYHYVVGQSEMLMNDKYFVMVDRDAQEIVWSKRDLKSERQMKDNLKFDMDSILTAYDDARNLGEDNNIRHYRIEDKKSSVRLADFYIDSESKFLKRLTYEYTTNQFVSIEFKVFEKDALFDAIDFDESQYITITKNTASPTGKYKRFHLSTPLQ